MAKIKDGDSYICSYCNAPWKTDGDGEPLCCDEAIQEWLDRGEPVSN